MTHPRGSASILLAICLASGTLTWTVPRSANAQAACTQVAHSNCTNECIVDGSAQSDALSGLIETAARALEGARTSELAHRGAALELATEEYSAARHAVPSGRCEPTLLLNLARLQLASLDYYKAKATLVPLECMRCGEYAADVDRESIHQGRQLLDQLRDVNDLTIKAGASGVTVTVRREDDLSLPATCKPAAASTVVCADMPAGQYVVTATLAGHDDQHVTTELAAAQSNLVELTWGPPRVVEPDISSGDHRIVDGAIDPDVARWSERRGAGLWASTSVVLDSDSGAAGTLAGTLRLGPFEPALGAVVAHGFIGPWVGATFYPAQESWILGLEPSITYLFPTIEETRGTDDGALLLLVGKLKVGAPLSKAVAALVHVSGAWTPNDNYQEFAMLGGAGISWRFQ